MSGCPLDCVWCHNPEARLYKPGILYVNQGCICCGLCGAACPNGCHSFVNGHIFNRSFCVSCGKCCDVCPAGALSLTATQYTVGDIMKTVMRDKAFYGTEGGITLSGGEPLAFPGFSLSLLKAAKKAGLNTCIETCGYTDMKIFISIAPYTDLLLYDIKDTDGERHKKCTGVYPDIIHNNLICADSLGIKTVLRCIMVKSVNMDDVHYQGLIKMFSRLKNCAGVELLPFHIYGSSKRKQLGLSPENRKERIPSAEDMAYVKSRLNDIIIRS